MEPFQRSYDLREVEPSVVEQILETIRRGEQGIASATLSPDGAELVVEAKSASDLDFLDGYIADLTRMQRRLRRKILYERRSRGSYAGDVDEELVRAGEVQMLGAGLAGLRGTTLRLFRFFEQEFLELARGFGADEVHHPVMLPFEILEEVGYFGHFPQHVTFCSHLPEDLPLLEATRRAVASSGGRLPDDFHGGLRRPRHALKPAVCLPCYPGQRDRVLPKGEPFVLTVQNHVFRYEGANFHPLSRLWDFSVRDIVFFGEHEELQRLRGAVMERTFALCEELDLEARIELANDPFFLDESRNKLVYQRLGEVKFELLIELPQRGESSAVSSFNLHRDFYTKTYNIRLADGGLAESACMGFGLERWLYAFLSQKGLDPGSWPARVARFVASDAPRGATRVDVAVS